MKKRWHYFKSNSITILILFVLILVSINGILEYINIKAKERHEEIASDMTSFKQSRDELWKGVNMMDLGFRGYYIIQNEGLLHPFQLGHNAIIQESLKIEETLKKYDLDPELFKKTEKALKDYHAIVVKLIDWRTEGEFEKINEVVESDPGLALWKQYEKFNNDYAVFEKAIFEKSNSFTNKFIFISSIIRISLLIFGIPTLLLVLYQLNNEKKRRRKLFRELDENNKKYLFNSLTNTENQEESLIIENLTRNLKKAADFISNITKGNLKIEWEGLTEKNKNANSDNLAGELIKMRNQMIFVKEEDRKRLWTTEGISKFSEIVRQNQENLHYLADEITSNIVKYLQANQAFLFFAEETDPANIELKLFGCYAYNRKKYIEKTIHPGQGLVGQTFLEKETTYLTEVPDDYVQITSGLGDAPPKSIIIIPLQFNDKVEGILEMASFRTFEDYEIHFLEKVGEIIASAIINIRSSNELKHLMQEMQIQSEELRSQEEEMRQNMEELEATQEELNRKAQEYQRIIEDKEEENQRQKEMITSLQNTVNA
jgi:CHASE3 domain sensor protein/GAF domain-containing protein